MSNRCGLLASLQCSGKTRWHALWSVFSSRSTFRILWQFGDSSFIQIAHQTMQQLWTLGTESPPSDSSRQRQSHKQSQIEPNNTSWVGRDQYSQAITVRVFILQLRGSELRVRATIRIRTPLGKQSVRVSSSFQHTSIIITTITVIFHKLVTVSVCGKINLHDFQTFRFGCAKQWLHLSVLLLHQICECGPPKSLPMSGQESSVVPSKAGYNSFSVGFHFDFSPLKLFLNQIRTDQTRGAKPSENTMQCHCNLVW